MLADDHGKGVHNHTFPYITIILRDGYWETLSTGKFWDHLDILGLDQQIIFIELILNQVQTLTIFISGPFGLRRGPRSEYGIDFKTKKD